jgi:hypothetical protein
METGYSDDLVRIDGNISQWIAGSPEVAAERYCPVDGIFSLEDLPGPIPEEPKAERGILRGLLPASRPTASLPGRRLFAGGICFGGLGRWRGKW